MADKQPIESALENKIRTLARSLGYSDTPLLSAGTHNIELRTKREGNYEHVYIARFTGISKGELQIVISPKLDEAVAYKINEIDNVRSGLRDSSKGKPVQGTQYPGLGNKLPSGNYVGRSWRVPINASLAELDNFLKVLSDQSIDKVSSLSEISSNQTQSDEKTENHRARYIDFGEAPNDNPNELNTFARKVRKGQPAFREKLIGLYDGRCAITGSSPLVVLEAAHIFDHSESGINHSDNGLLLRADIHLLFDEGLLKINPDNLLVEISHNLKDTEYWKLNGAKLRERTDGSFPSKEYLMKKWYSRA